MSFNHRYTVADVRQAIRVMNNRINGTPDVDATTPNAFVANFHSGLYGVNRVDKDGHGEHTVIRQTGARECYDRIDAYIDGYEMGLKTKGGN